MKTVSKMLKKHKTFSSRLLTLGLFYYLCARILKNARLIYKNFKN